ncbi:MAG: hypothetical protein [brine shrimp arlivirus 1]|nr:MAG: hypothetical protein [brine shrimp arlivirus 1]UNI74017.1 MAG: hypothetical protein [brine shrimp arlivirus 1]UNI74027.1 MAG: hypothetical protein [brine shrimp arlivirus 1]UNI74032.1 MAG: hypothetical protein [brine shrimp arlivirus 1]UNI74067.1 MAG: hypothetical protein [brine shrimp arlivirus 1]
MSKNSIVKTRLIFGNPKRSVEVLCSMSYQIAGLVSGNDLTVEMEGSEDGEVDLCIKKDGLVFTKIKNWVQYVPVNDDGTKTIPETVCVEFIEPLSIKNLPTINNILLLE